MKIVEQYKKTSLLSAGQCTLTGGDRERERETSPALIPILIYREKSKVNTKHQKTKTKTKTKTHKTNSLEQFKAHPKTQPLLHFLSSLLF
jgi:hypothetical protein